MRTHLSHLFALVLLLLGHPLAGAAPTLSAADEGAYGTLVFTNGQESEGHILEIIPPPETGRPPRTIVFRTTGGLVNRINTALVEKFIGPEDRARDLIPTIQDAILAGDMLRALETAQRLYGLSPEDPDVRRWAIRVAWETYQDAHRLTLVPTIDDAFERWDGLALYLQQTGLPLINPNPGPGENYDVSSQYRRDQIEALRLRVDTLLRQATARVPVDLRLLGRAGGYNQRLITLTQGDYPSRFNEILIHEASGRLDRAVEVAAALQTSVSSGSSVVLLDQVTNKLEDLRARQAHPPEPDARRESLEVLVEGLTTATAPEEDPGETPGPQPGPSASQPGEADPSVSQPPPPPAPSGGPLWPRLRRRMTQRDWYGMVGEVTAYTRENQAVQLVLGALVFILAFWVIPHKLATVAAGRGSISASVWAPRIKRLGLLAALGWMISPIFRLGRGARATGAGPSEQICPHCSGNLANLELYRDLNFLICPHCGEGITPIFDLGDYIRHLVDQIDSVRRGKSMGSDLNNKIEREAMLKLTRAVLTLTVRQRASDLHVDASGDGLDLRARVDGVLGPLDIHIPKAVERAFVSAIKVMADLDITERRMPQDGRFEVQIDGAKIDIRINTSPTGLGEKISMRLLDVRNVEVPLDRLGISDQMLPKFRECIHSSHGLMLVTGPTGSGKSTTLYVALNEINDGTRNIITIEDPIEYIFKGLNQHQVNPAASFTFATGLRSIVRQDPDVIMVGEIRDRETADIAVDAATTGHLVMTTLHTIDAAGAYQRLAEVGVDPRRFAPTLLLICAQRLIRLSCSNCKEPYIPEASDLGALEIATTQSDIIYYRGKGCETCQRRGFRGRLGLFEIMIINEELQSLMEGHSPIAAVREAARRVGMRSLREEGVLRVLSGLSTAEEVVRVVK
jgi:type II secretory ATPase GspE/PulE/Tfp pilus assembly ATPase PilB-like protein